MRVENEPCPPPVDIGGQANLAQGQYSMLNLENAHTQFARTCRAKQEKGADLIDH